MHNPPPPHPALLHSETRTLVYAVYLLASPSRFLFGEKQTFARSESAVAELQSCFNKPRQNTSVERRVKTQLQHVARPVEREALEQARRESLLRPEPSAASTSGLRAVARHRDIFRDAVFCFAFGETLMWKKLSMAKCMPFVCVWLQLEPLDMSLLGEASLGGECSMNSGQHPLMGWGYDAESFQICDPWSEEGLTEVVVVMDCEHMGHGILLTSHTPVLLQSVLPSEMLANATAAVGHGGSHRSGRGETAASSSATASASASGYVVRLDPPVSACASTGPIEEEASESNGSESGDGEEEIKRGQIYDALEADRQEWSDVLSVSHTWFNYGVSGGAWQMVRTGRSTYGPRVTAKKGSDAARFLRQFSMTSSAAFEYHKFGEAVAHELAKLWQAKVTSYVACWLLADEPASFPWEQYPPFEIPPDVALDDDLLPPVVRKRKSAILEMRPSG
eukprot:3111232-Amphidinium_carterae.8